MGRILRDSELIGEPRHRHVDNVVPLHRPEAGEVYDQDCGGRRPVVVLSPTQQKAVLGLLAQLSFARPALAADVATAMAWLSPHPSIGGAK